MIGNVTYVFLLEYFIVMQFKSLVEVNNCDLIACVRVRDNNE